MSKAIVLVSAIGEFTEFACLVDREADFYAAIAQSLTLREIIQPAFRNLEVFNS
jgi:hypothetical protein